MKPTQVSLGTKSLLVVVGAVCVAAWLVPGCSASESESNTTGIEGDWFYCKDDGCTAVTSKGLRFGSGGECAMLIGFNDPLGANPDYCVKDGPRHIGSYTWDGTTLSIGLDSDGDVVPFAATLEDNVLRLTGEGPLKGEERALRKLPAAGSSGTCTEARFEGGSVAGPDGGAP